MNEASNKFTLPAAEHRSIDRNRRRHPAAIAVSWAASPPPNPPHQGGGLLPRHSMKTRASAAAAPTAGIVREPSPLDGGGLGGVMSRTRKRGDGKARV